MTRRAGTTLVELMVALAIVSMLMVAAMITMNSVIRVRKVEEGQMERSAQAAPWRTVLFTDLLNATGLRLTPKGFVLQTHAWLERSTLELRHLDAQVVYEVRQVGVRPWLVRTQKSPLSGGSFTELVFPGVSAIRLASLGAGVAQPGQGEGMPAAMGITLDLEGGPRESVTVSFRRE